MAAVKKLHTAVEKFAKKFGDKQSWDEAAKELVRRAAKEPTRTVAWFPVVPAEEKPRTVAFVPVVPAVQSPGSMATVPDTLKEIPAREARAARRKRGS
jgi:hypothetical protein